MVCLCRTPISSVFGSLSRADETYSQEKESYLLHQTRTHGHQNDMVTGNSRIWTRIHPRGRWPPVLYFWPRERVFFRNFMNHQRILPLPTSINIYIISVSFVFCHCPQALYFSKSDQFSFRFRVSRIYWRRGRARPEFWRVQLRGKERIFIGSDRRFYTAHKRSFLFFTNMGFRFRVNRIYCGLTFSKLIFGVSI